MLTGTAQRALQQQIISRPSGLLLPMASSVQPLDAIGVYITGEELFGADPSPAETATQLQRMPFVQVLEFIAHTLAAYRRPGVATAEADRQFAQQWLLEPARTRALNRLRDPKRRLVVPQALYALAKLAAFWCDDTLPPSADAQPALALFGAVAGLDRAGELDPADAVVDTVIGPMSSFLMANQYLNKPLDEDHLMAHFVRQWLELPAERADDPEVVDLEDAFVDVTGAPLRDVLVVASFLRLRAATAGPSVPPDYFDELGWSTARLRAALRVFATDAGTLRAELQEETGEYGVPWGFSKLGQYPVVLLDDGSLLVLDVNLLVGHVFGGLTLYDLVAPLSANGRRPDPARADRIKGCVRHLAEVYAKEVLESLTGSGQSCRRVYGEAELRHAVGRKKQRQKVADAAVDYGDGWVIVEITTSKLTRESVAGRPGDLSADVDKLVGKVAQLDATIAAVRSRERVLTGAAPAPGRRFHPLLVLSDPFPVNPHSMTLLRRRVAARGLLTGKDIGPLEVVGIVELEMLEALAEQGGPSMREVLAAKEHGALFRDSVRNYLLLERRDVLRRSDRVQSLFDKAWQPAVDALTQASPARGSAS